MYTAFPKDYPITITAGKNTTTIINGFGNFSTMEEATGIISVPPETGSVAVGYYAVALIRIFDIGAIGEYAELFGSDPTTGITTYGSALGTNVSFQTGPTVVTSDMVEPPDFLNEMASGSFSVGQKWPSGTASSTVPYTTLAKEDSEGIIEGIFLLCSVKARPVKGSFYISKPVGTGLDIVVEELFFHIVVTVPGGGTTIMKTDPEPGAVNTNNIFVLTLGTDALSSEIVIPSTATVHLSNSSSGATFSVPVRTISSDGKTVTCTAPTTAESLPSNNYYAAKIIFPNPVAGKRAIFGCSQTILYVAIP
jgi:hypothetical protein